MSTLFTKAISIFNGRFKITVLRGRHGFRGEGVKDFLTTVHTVKGLGNKKRDNGGRESKIA